MSVSIRVRTIAVSLEAYWNELINLKSLSQSYFTGNDSATEVYLQKGHNKFCLDKPGSLAFILCCVSSWGTFSHWLCYVLVPHLQARTRLGRSPVISLRWLSIPLGRECYQRLSEILSWGNLSSKLQPFPLLVSYSSSPAPVVMAATAHRVSATLLSPKRTEDVALRIR